MLRDTTLNPAYNKNRDDLRLTTARALTLGNDITAHGHDVQFVEDTVRTYSNLPGLTKQTAIYATEHLLVNLQDRYNDNNDNSSVPHKLRLSERFIDTPGNRMMFWACYKGLRARGLSRRMIITSLVEYLR